MSRENQGLRVALIVFVMLTIVLGVNSFVFFHHFDEARRGQEHARREADRYCMAAQDYRAENEQLKKLIGGSPDEKLSSVQDALAVTCRVVRTRTRATGAWCVT